MISLDSASHAGSVDFIHLQPVWENRSRRNDTLGVWVASPKTGEWLGIDTL